MSPSSVPLELWYEICGLVVAEYLDAVIAGDLSYPPTRDPADGDDPARAAPNPVVPLLQTSRMTRRAALMVLSDTLGISIDDTTPLSRLAVKPWTCVQPVRLRLWRARTATADISNAPPDVLAYVSDGLLLQTYERLAYLIEGMKTVGTVSLSASTRQEQELQRAQALAAETIQVDAMNAGRELAKLIASVVESTMDSNAGQMLLRRLMSDLFEKWMAAIPHGVLRTFAYGRLLGTLAIGIGYITIENITRVQGVDDVRTASIMQLEHDQWWLQVLQEANLMDFVYVSHQEILIESPTVTLIYGEHDFDFDKLLATCGLGGDSEDVHEERHDDSTTEPPIFQRMRKWSKRLEQQSDRLLCLIEAKLAEMRGLTNQ